TYQFLCVVEETRIGNNRPGFRLVAGVHELTLSQQCADPCPELSIRLVKEGVKAFVSLADRALQRLYEPELVQPLPKRQHHGSIYDTRQLNSARLRVCCSWRDAVGSEKRLPGKELRSKESRIRNAIPLK